MHKSCVVILVQRDVTSGKWMMQLDSDLVNIIHKTRNLKQVKLEAQDASLLDHLEVKRALRSI